MPGNELYKERLKRAGARMISFRTAADAVAALRNVGLCESGHVARRLAAERYAA